MGLNMKNERVHELAREAARVTGKSQTAAIEAARRFRECEAEETAPDAIRSTDDLYDDETGLPR